MIARTVIASFVLALAASHAHADEPIDACQKAPTRTCVLETVGSMADGLTQAYPKASLLLAVSAMQQRAGHEDASTATLARATEAIKQIPASEPNGTPPPGLVAVRAAKGDMDGAIALARGFDKPFQRVYGLGAVGAAMQRQGRAEEAKTWFGQAVEAAQSAPADQRAFLISLVARGQADVGSPDAAATYDLAVSAAKATGSGGAVTSVIGQRIRSGQFDRAFVDINDLPATSQDYLLVRLVKGLANAGRIDDALTIAPSISTDFYRVDVYTHLAIADFLAGRAMAAAELLVKAQAIAASASVPSTKSEALASAAGAEAIGGMTLRENAHFEEARKALEAETVESFKWALATKLTRSFLQAGRTQEALDVLRAKLDAKSQSSALAEIAEDLIGEKLYPAAFAAIAGMPDDPRRVGTMLEFADKLSK